MPIQLEIILEEIKKEFEKLLMSKTGWGRNEILHQYEKAVRIALAKNIDAY